MCGIAGTLELRAGGRPDEAVLRRMAGQLVHRGPDDDGFAVQAEAGLAFRRLSIVDLAHGQQPLYDASGSIVAVCNGEIFNHRELRAQLQAQGVVFRTECDVEVLIPLYQRHGLDFVKQLNGQFAIALYDNTLKRLVLARDHVGICPLFYTLRGDTLVFGSEIKALLAHPAVPRRVDLQGLDQVLSFPGLVSPTTMFEGIHALRPGHLLLASVDGTPREQAYWDLLYPTHSSEERSDDDWVDALDTALRRAVDLRLNADVPVGYYLSGGLDSCLIGSLTQAVRPDPLRPSFSITFADPAHNERRFQDLYRQHVPSVHHEIPFDWNDVAGSLRTAVLHAESPLKESYNTCSLALSAKVRESGVRVALTGEGADELFAGYVGYRFDAMRGARSQPGDDGDDFDEAQLRHKLWGNRDFFYEQNYHALRGVKQDLYSPAVAQQASAFDALREGVVNKSRLRGRHPVHQRSYVDFKLRLSDHLLADHGDRVAYANSIEARYPFLDIGVIELAQKMPPRLKLRDLVEKYVVRQVARRHLPRELIEREKFHFIAPGSPALLGRHIDWVQDLLAPETIRRQGYFNVATIERLKQIYARPGFRLNLPFDNDLLMIVLTFGLFLEAFDLPDLG